MEAKENTIKATTRYSGAKIQFNKEEQLTIKKNINAPTDEMVKIIYRLGQTAREDSERKQEKVIEKIQKQAEKQSETLKELMREMRETRDRSKTRKTKKRNRAEMRHEVENSMGESTSGSEADAETEATNERDRAPVLVIDKGKRKTYATITEGTKNKPWTTPEKKQDTYETIVRWNEEKDTRKTINKIKQLISEKAKEVGGIKNIVPISDGQIILQFRNDEQRRSLFNTLKNDTEIIIRDRYNNKKPKLRITGVAKGYSDEKQC